jgi:hypothetical protein
MEPAEILGLPPIAVLIICYAAPNVEGADRISAGGSAHDRVADWSLEDGTMRPGNLFIQRPRLD